jgi:predicted membrane protein
MYNTNWILLQHDEKGSEKMTIRKPTPQNAVAVLSAIFLFGIVFQNPFVVVSSAIGIVLVAIVAICLK